MTMRGRGFTPPGAGASPRARGGAGGAARAAVSVDTLRLRVPGRTAAGGRDIAEQALRQVADRLPEGLHGDFGALRLRVRPRRMGDAHVRDAIADALIEALEARGRGNHD